jgi:hypothetical protein
MDERPCTAADEEAIVPVISVSHVFNEADLYVDLRSVHLGQYDPRPDPIASVRHRDAHRAVPTWVA